MKNKMIAMASIIGILMVFGTNSAMAQYMSSGNTGVRMTRATNTMMGGGMMGRGITNGNNNGGCTGINPGSMMASEGLSTKGMM